MITLRDRYANYQHHWQNEFSMDTDMVDVVVNFANQPAFYKGFVSAKTDIEAKRYILEIMKRGLVLVSSILSTEQITLLASADILSFFEALICVESRFMAIDTINPHLDQKEACIIYGVVVGMAEIRYPVDTKGRELFINEVIGALAVGGTVANNIEELLALRPASAVITH